MNHINSKEKKAIERQKTEIQYFDSELYLRAPFKPIGYPLIKKFHYLEKFDIINSILRKILYKLDYKMILINIGSGEGMEAENLLKKNPNFKIIAMDISNMSCLKSLNRAKQKNFLENFNIICSDGSSLPLRSNIAHFVYFFASLHHIPKYKKAIRDSNEVLKNNGVLILFEPFISVFIDFLIRKVLKYQNNEYFGYPTYKFLLNKMKNYFFKINYISIYTKKIWTFYPKIVAKLIDNYNNLLPILKLFHRVFNFFLNSFIYCDAITFFLKKPKN